MLRNWTLTIYKLFIAYKYVQASAHGRYKLYMRHSVESDEIQEFNIYIFDLKTYLEI